MPPALVGGYSRFGGNISSLKMDGEYFFETLVSTYTDDVTTQNITVRTSNLT
jgi:hypothetical protein